MSGRGFGRRDFSRFNEKLEKHVERLPDYAQRAQEKLQRYLPPSAEGGQGDRPQQPGQVPPGQSPQPEQPPRPLMPSLPSLSSLPTRPGDIPVVAEARATWARWNDPAAKHQRRIRRTSRALTLWIMLTLLCGLALIAGVTGVIGAGVASTPVVAGGAGVVVFGTFGVRAGVRLRGLKRSEPPVTTVTPALPPSTSAARRPMERLRESESSLEELLSQLSMPVGGAPSAVPELSVEQARQTAREAAEALRALAARLQAVERGRDHAPAAERGPLDAAVRTLREQLDDGLTGYGELVAAAGRAVAASSGGAAPARESLTDATDHLAGLAIALRELS